MRRLTKSEEEIMRMLWEEKEPVTVSKLIEKLPAPKPPHSTISSVVRILEKKNFVDHKTYGRTHAYYPIIDKKDYTRFSIKKLARHYFHGSINELVSFLVTENDLSLNELAELTEQLRKEKS